VNLDELYKEKNTKFGVFAPEASDDPSVQDAHLLEQLEASLAQAQAKARQ
jgi:hypothetical protein